MYALRRLPLYITPPHTVHHGEARSGGDPQRPRDTVVFELRTERHPTDGRNSGSGDHAPQSLPSQRPRSG